MIIMQWLLNTECGLFLGRLSTCVHRERNCREILVSQQPDVTCFNITAVCKQMFGLLILRLVLSDHEFWKTWTHPFLNTLSSPTRSIDVLEQIPRRNLEFPRFYHMLRHSLFNNKICIFNICNPSIALWYGQVLKHSLNYYSVSVDLYTALA